MKNESKEQIKSVLRNAAVIGAQIAGVVVLALALGYRLESRGQYVITEKSNNRISYHAVSDPKNVHTMTFSGRAQKLYPYIHVGDTISGIKSEMDRPVAQPTHKVLSVFGYLEGNTIKEKRINGSDEFDFDKIVAWDNWARRMANDTVSQKQK